MAGLTRPLTQVAPNGHRNASKRRLRDDGIKYVLETCSTMFNYAARQRHLPPYVESPFRLIEISRNPVEDAKPIVVFAADKEQRFLEACDDWQTVYHNDATAPQRRLSPKGRLQSHQAKSRRTMGRLPQWLNRQFDEKLVESSESSGMVATSAVC